MILHPIVKLLSDAIIPHPKPVVYISGGLDSTIILHHLHEKTDETIYTYTYGFFPDDNEFESASYIAEEYGTVHKAVLINNFLKRAPEVLQYLSRPKFNYQTLWVAEQAFKDGRQSCYIAEALDEHFGGYWYKPDLNYLESWADHFHFIRTTYKEIHKMFDLRCEIPFTYLDFHETLPYWDSGRGKEKLREIYKGIIPESARTKRKRSGAPRWRRLWDREISFQFPGVNPTSDEEIRKYLNQYVTWVWIRVNKIESG